jgi:hypothetical protein
MLEYNLGARRDCPEAPVPRWAFRRRTSIWLQGTSPTGLHLREPAPQGRTVVAALVQAHRCPVVPGGPDRYGRLGGRLSKAEAVYRYFGLPLQFRDGTFLPWRVAAS